MSQITYKLFDYGASSDSYAKILQNNFANQENMNDEDEEAAALDKDEVIDVVTNFMACQSSVPTTTTTKVEKIIQQYCSDPDIEKEKHYEFYFNLS